MDQEICNLYIAGANSNELAIKFNCSNFKILSILKNAGVPRRSGSQIRRKFFLKEDYFSKIDSPSKAYILGFIYADGCVFQNKKGSGCSIYIHPKDVEIINFIRSELTDKPIYTTKHGLVGLTLYSSRLVNDLISLGVFVAKSLILNFPTENQVPKHLLNHFIRGVFDGDGSVSFSLGKPNAKFCGSKNFIKGLHSFLLNFSNIKSNIFDSKKNCFYLSFQSKDSFRRLFQFLYVEDGFFLSRKKKKFIETLESKNFLN